MARTAKQTAVTEFHSADLATEFGYNYAVRLFGQEAVDSLPIRTVGKNKGKPKGVLCWLKVTKPGWDRRYGLVGFGTCRAWIAPFSSYSEGDAVTGMFLGRVQTLCASACYLGEENRAKEMARIKADYDRLTRDYAEEDAERAARSA